ncbi:MAG: hypothetical protein NT039_00345 [Candidatus Berkelbacteria bacterium]|nr:hypothetical protein [Candidatus Berkelbacteria bacterium]
MPEEFFESGNKIIDWSVIKTYQEEGTISGLLMALLESDKLLNFMLADMGYPGPTIYHKIKSAKERFTNLPGLMKALEIKERVFSRYEEKVTAREVELAVKEYKQAIIDLSSNSDVSPPSLWERMKAYIDYNYVSQPKNLKNLIIYFLIFFIVIFVLDGTHLGQAIIHSIASYFARFISIIIVIALIILALFITVIGFVVFLERRKEG